jgi:hypothetical protein
MLCWFGVIVNHCQPRTTKPLTQRSSVIPSKIVVCPYYKGGRCDKTIILVVTRVEGIGPMLLILDGGRCIFPFVSVLHRLLWQHWIFLLGPGGQNLHHTSLPILLPQLSNMLTIPMSASRTQSELSWLLSMLALLVSMLSWLNVLDAQGDLFLDEVFFFRSSFLIPLIFLWW